MAEVREAEVDDRRTFVGTVMPLRISTVGSPVEGLVIELAVEEGDRVKRGQKLAQLRDTQLRLQLAVAAAELDVARLALDQLKTSLPEQIKQAEARMMAAKAVMEFTSSRLKRKEKLAANAKGSISEDEVQEARSAATAGVEKHREAELALAESRATQPAKLKQAEAQMAAKRGEVDRLNDQIGLHQIVAPFDGYVTDEHTELGQWLIKGASVVEMVQVDSVEVRVAVPESYALRLPANAKATITVGALPDRKWEAPVVAIVPKADVRSRSFPVKVRLKNEPGPGGLLLKPGMFARVTLPIAGKTLALMVPKDAVVLGGRTPVVFTIGRPPTHSAQPVPVELGPAMEGWIEVHGDLKPDDRVVVEGNERLRPGLPLQIVVPKQPPSKAPSR